MCCRLNPSHSVARIIAGLYILLATFLIGFFAAQSFSSLYRFGITNSNIVEELTSPLDLESDPNSPKPCQLLVYKFYRHMAKGRSIGITNDGTKPIYLHVDATGELTEFAIDSVPIFDGANQPELPIHEIVLQPGWAYSIDYPLKSESVPFTFAIAYREDKTGLNRLLKARFGADDDRPRSCVTSTMQKL